MTVAIFGTPSPGFVFLATPDSGVTGIASEIVIGPPQEESPNFGLARGLIVRDVAEVLPGQGFDPGRVGLLQMVLVRTSPTGFALDQQYDAPTMDTSARLWVNGSSVTQPVSNAGTFAVQDSEKLADNAAFTDGTTKVLPAGFIYDETAGTALTENDVAAARIDSKRAQVMVIEGATRGTRAAVLAVQPAYNETGLVVRTLPHAQFANGTFTAAATGTATPQYAQSYSLNVVPVGAVTSWTVVLEAALDGVNYSTILTHTNVVPGANIIQTSGATRTPTAIFRVRCTAIVLGAGTNIGCWGLAMP